MTMNKDLRIVVFEEEGVFVAQCLEHDISTQAEDRQTLRERMDCLIGFELEEMQQKGQELDPAPERFHKMWEEGNHAYKEVAA